MANQVGQSRYVVQERGNRAAPHRRHPRYCALKLLRERLGSIAESNALSFGKSLLDYGCGNRPYEQLFKQKFSQYVAADFPGNVHAQINVDSRGRLPLEDGSIDCVLSTQVLEHVVGPRFYLSEAYRVLKPDGSLILSTHGTWPYHPDPTDYWRWTIDGLRCEINSAGFDIWRVHSILGIAACSIQLWQDATLEKLPRVMRPAYIRLLQSIIGIIERRNPSRLSLDACIYIVTARKRAVRKLTPAAEEDRRLALAAEELAACIPVTAKVILVDQDELGTACLPNREVVPFLERDGRYDGPPKDGGHAVQEFNRLRRAGALNISCLPGQLFGGSIFTRP